jgi:hypothetical protein
MQEVSFHRLYRSLAALIFPSMKKELSRAATTSEELYALQMQARLARARFVGDALKWIYQKAVSALSAKVVRHA